MATGGDRTPTAGRAQWNSILRKATQNLTSSWLETGPQASVKLQLTKKQKESIPLGQVGGIEYQPLSFYLIRSSCIVPLSLSLPSRFLIGFRLVFSLPIQMLVCLLPLGVPGQPMGILI